MRGREKNNTVCFSGHRPEKIPSRYIEEIMERLKAEIEKAVSLGYTRFISGMSRGVDMWAAEFVLDIKKDYPSVELECAIPYNGQELRWHENERERYHDIMRYADIITCLSPGYTQTCMFDRNTYMVKESSLLIACYDLAKKGGTANTCNTALRENIEIINICPYIAEGLE